MSLFLNLFLNLVQNAGNLSPEEIRDLVTNLASELGESVTPDELQGLASWLIQQGKNLDLQGGTLDQVSMKWDGGNASVSCVLFVNQVPKSDNRLGFWKYPSKFKVSGTCHLSCTPAEGKRPCSCPCGEKLTVQVSGSGSMPKYNSFGNNIVANGEIK